MKKHLLSFKIFFTALITIVLFSFNNATAATVSATVNTPANGATVYVGNGINLTSTLNNNPGHGIVSTTYSVNGTTVSTPYTPTTPGPYSITVTIVYYLTNAHNTTASVTSPANNFTVIVSAVTTTITSPAGGTTVVAGSNFTISATATTSCPGNINYVTFSGNGFSNNDGISPYSQSFTASTIPGAYVYTVTGVDNCGSSSSAPPITINVVPVAPTTTGGSTCGAGPVTLSASGSPGGGTYNWYTSAAGTTLLQSSTSSTYTTPSISSTTTYYVSYTLSGETSSLAPVTATVSTTSPVLSTAPTGGGLTFSYPFSGNTTDASTNGNNGTVTANVALTTDRFGVTNSAYAFTGTSSAGAAGYIYTKNSSAGLQTFTINMWFKTTTAQGMLIGFGDTKNTTNSTNDDRKIYMNGAGQLIFGIYNGATDTIRTGTSYNDGTWHMVTAELSAAGMQLYVDGSLKSSKASYTVAQSYTGYWRIGEDILSTWPDGTANFCFNGSLDDIAVYTSAIPASTIYTLYGAGSPPVCAGSPLTLQANTVSGASYSWSGPGGFSSSLQNPTVDPTANTSEAGKYTVTITTPTQCPEIVNVTAVVYAAPAPTIAVSNPAPAANAATTISLSSAVVAGDTYSWSFGTGASTTTATGTGPFSITWSTTGAQTISLTETNANGCSTTVYQNVAVGGQYVTTGNYAFTQPITLKSSLINAGSVQGISSTLYNFPALVSITEPALIKSAAPSCTNNIMSPTGGPNGYDFAFTTQNSTAELNYQVESYNTTTGTLLVWVQVPALTPTDVGLNFYFGSTTPNHSTTFTAATWSSDYNEVYHFDEVAATGVVGAIIDATSKGNNATQTSCTPSAGQIGGAYAFNATNSSYIKSTATSPAITGSFTLSAWVQPTSFSISPSPGSNAYDYKIICNETTTSGYKLGMYGASNTTVYPEVETRSSSGTSFDRYSSGTPTPVNAVSLSAWHYIQGVYDSSTGTFYSYLDGNLNYSVTGATGSASTASNTLIGTDLNLSNYLYGLLDEVRVSTVAKSADWIRAEYYNQSNPSSFTVSNTAITTNSLSMANTIGGSIQYTWAGGSTNPALAANWNCTGSGATGILPPTDGTASLVIPVSTNYPSYTAAPPSIYSLTMSSGSQLYLNGNTLNIGCHVYNYGGTISSAASSSSPTITAASTGGLNFISSVLATQYLYGSTASGATNVANLTVANTATNGTVDITGGPVNLYNTLTMTSGKLLIDNANSGVLTLMSNAAGTAAVDVIPSTSSITGNVNVQRYITGGSAYRGYRLLSSPININSSLNQTSTQANIGLIYLGGGILTGGPGTGFTTYTLNPLTYLYNETRTVNHLAYSGGQNVGVTSVTGAVTRPGVTPYSVSTLATNLVTVTSNVVVPVGNSYLVYFVGDNTSPNLAPSRTPENSVVTDTGYLNQGNILLHFFDGQTGNNTLMTYTATSGAATPGLHQIGNPYASTIDIDKVYNDNSSSINPTFWEFKQTSQAYYAINAISNTTQSSNISQYIASGQGFFVGAKAAGGTVTFKESEKIASKQLVSGGTPLLLLNQKQSSSISAAELQPANVLSGLHLQITQDTLTSTQTGIYFSKSWSDSYSPKEDAVDLDGTSVYLSSYSSDNKRLSINQLGDYSGTNRKVVKLFVSAASYGAYNLSLADIKNIDTLYNVYLRDHMLNDSVNLRTAKTPYNFNITTDTASYGANRFDLVL
ncbi:S-layer family protein, partial [Mucilaginibacter sp. L196]|uniref:beta strand repeat-containing protein n=1 Tax=Mucilaginibacter sp. L196 TaxID=1641870 RepID=UPI001C201EE4